MVKARLTPAVGAGFTLIAQRPVSVLVWGLVYILISFAPVAVLLAGSLPEIIAGYREMLADPESMAAGPPAALAKLRGLQGLQLLCGLAAVAIVYTAIFRAVLRPEQSSSFSLRFGMDEFRVAGVAAVLYIFMIVAIVALVLVGAIIGVAAAAASGGAPSAVGILVIVLLALAAVIALIYLGGRLAMALPMTVAQGKFRLFEAWTLTRGYGWKLVGVFLLLVLIVIGIEILTLGIAGGVIFAMVGGFDASSMSNLTGGFAKIAPLVAILSLVYLALMSVLLPITIAPWARAYQLIDQTTATAASALFE
jgi:hypothetical protein